MTRRIFFYGCSLTAGDELSDYEYFPWMKQIRSQQEYRLRKKLTFQKSIEISINYHASNKEKAYPALVSTDLIGTVNRAECGSSIEEQVFYILEDYEQGCIQQGSTVYFQLIGYPREIYLEDGRVTSLNYTDIVENSWEPDILNQYKLAKLNTHGLDHWVVLDHMLLITIKNFLNNKHIPFYLINLDASLHSRNNELNKPLYRHLKQLFEKEMNVLDLQSKLDPIKNKLINGHWNAESHRLIAELVTEHYWQNNNA